MRASLFATVALAALAVAAARCPAGCSGHGSCGTNDLCTCWKNWQGPACSERTCEFGVSWASSASNPHKYAECSAKGTCDRDTGLCTCVEGYTGLACERSACPGDCSGHGKCRLVRDLSSGYALWDADKIQGCVCDGGYTGPDCSQRLCPKGDDPLSVCNSANTHQVQTIYVRGSPRVNLGAFPSGYVATVGTTVYQYKGDLSIHFTDNTGEEWITNRVSNIFSAASAADVEKALEALPNYRIPNVAVSDVISDSTTRTIRVTFHDGRVSGNQNVLTFDSPLGCQVAGCHPKYDQPQLTTITNLNINGAFTAATALDPINWRVTDDSVFDTSLIADAAVAAAHSANTKDFGSSTFRARVTVYPSAADATTANKYPAHAYKVDWDLSKHYTTATAVAENYFVHLYGTKVSDDTTFTLTIRGRTTLPISWGSSSTTLSARAAAIGLALDTEAMELGGDGSNNAAPFDAVTVTCYGGFDPTPAGNGFSTAFGVNTAYCVIVPKLLEGLIASDLIVTPSFGTESINAGASAGKYGVITNPQTDVGIVSLAGKSSAAADCDDGADTTPDIYANTQTTFGGSVLVVCASITDTAPLVFYSSPTGERLTVSGAGNSVAPAAIAVATAFGTARVQDVAVSGAISATVCKISYAGVQTANIGGTYAAADFATALNALGLGLFSVTKAANTYTVTYDSPAIGYLSDFVCTGANSALTATITTTTEQGLATDGFTYVNNDAEFPASAISLRTLPDTRDATTGVGRSRVPIGYGMYLSIPAVYYNAAWIGGNGGLAANSFTVLVTVDIATAWAAQTTAASVDVEDAECSNRGHCDRTTGTCACYEGYYGDHCGLQTILV